MDSSFKILCKLVSEMDGVSIVHKLEQAYSLADRRLEIAVGSDRFLELAGIFQKSAQSEDLELTLVQKIKSTTDRQFYIFGIQWRSLKGDPQACREYEEEVWGRLADINAPYDKEINEAKPKN